MATTVRHTDGTFPGQDMQFYLTSVASITSLFSIFAVVRHQHRINKTERRIKFVEQRAAYTPSELQKDFESERAAREAGFRPVFEGTHMIGYKGDVLVKGQVDRMPGDQPIITIPKGLFAKEVESVLKIRYKQEIYSNDMSDPGRGKYVINLKRILQNCQVDMNKEFAVRDERTGAKVVIANYDRINYEKALDILRYSEERRTMMPHEFLFTLGVLATKFVAQLFFRNIDVSTFRGISVGVRDSEVGIKIGSGVAVIGEVVYNFADKTMRIDRPELILNERLSYLAELRKELDGLVYNRNVWIVVAAVSTLYVGRQAFKYLRKMDRLPEWLKRHLQN